MAKNWAVCIGINHYENLTPLRFAVHDAESMRDWFEKEAGFDKVYLFTDNSPPITDTDASKSYPSQPSYGRLMRFLESRFARRFLSIGDNLWFFFSGHGIRHIDQDYLMLSDSSALGDLVEKTGIPFRYVTERLRRSGADNVIFITDACRNESSSKGLGVGEEKHRGVISIASCSPSERSFEIEEKQHGSFTYALLESLRINGTGNYATVERLDQRLRQRVPELNRQYNKGRQTPYVIPEPLPKSQLILLPSQATVQDVSALKTEAYRANNNKDIELAKIFMTQVLIAAPADPDALAWFKNIWLEELRYEHKFQMRDLDKSRKSQIKGLKEQLELERSQNEKEIEQKQQEKEALEQNIQLLQSRIKQREQQLIQERSQNKQELEPNIHLENQLVQERSQTEVEQNEIMRLVEQLVERKSSLSNSLKDFNFQVLTVNKRGEEVKREKGQAEYFNEDLGNGINLEMVSIPGGKFLMGTEDEEIERLVQKFDWDGYRREKPQHEVTVKSFYMGKYPVTQAQWKAVANLSKVKRDLDVSPSRFKGENLPVEQINWYDAEEFCARLAKKTGKEYRLPREAEWEYACRAGTTTPFHFGKTITTNLANYRGTDRKIEDKVYPGKYAKEAPGMYREKTTEVGSFPPNGLGLYDMHGNVWEWCIDNWHENYEGAPTDGSAWTIGGNETHSPLRGGAWVSIPNNCRSAYRNFNIRRRGLINNGVGFRVVCESGRTQCTKSLILASRDLL